MSAYKFPKFSRGSHVRFLSPILQMSKKFRFAAIQLTSTTNIDENLQNVEDLVKCSVESGAALVGLPENFAYMGTDLERLRNINSLEPICYEFTSYLASRFKVCIYGGGTPFKCNETGSVFNRLTCFDKNGSHLASYDKINLFKANLPSGDVYDESVCVSPGFLGLS